MSWFLPETLVECPKKDCRHTGKLKEFDCYLEALDLDYDGEETVLTCPECGCEFNATIDLHIDYVVFAGDIVEARE